MHRQLQKFIVFRVLTRKKSVQNIVTARTFHKINVTPERYFIVNLSHNLSKRSSWYYIRSLNSEPNKEPNHKDEVHESLREKILYNSVLDLDNVRLSFVAKKIILEKESKRKAKKTVEQDKETHEFPLALQYLRSSSDPPIPSTDCEDTDDPVQLPFASVTRSRLAHEAQECSTDEEEQLRNTENWMRDYELYDETQSKPWQLNYGTADAAVPVSKVPCGGCGANLHCQDTAIPGFLPRELFLHRTEVELRSVKCQRCHFLAHYNVALNVSVSPEEYPRLLSHIKDKKALVILMVDLTDFPCSIWPGIIDIIGTKRPVVIVGNKVDLLPPDGRGFVEHITKCLQLAAEQAGLTAANVKHIALVSAATGFGVEQLITKLHNIWDYQNDVYLMGCTNVGKSTLFNALLQSDFCKVKAVDLLQRATTSPWPGTTLNLLKFPILRPSGWRLYKRTERLLAEQKRDALEKKLLNLQLKKTKDPSLASLIGHIGRTFRDESEAVIGKDPFSMSMSLGSPTRRIGLDPNDEEFEKGRWCYDTPGTVQPDQVLNLLTTRELMLTLPRKLLLPRTFLVRSGQSLLLAGLGRLDYLGGNNFIRLTVLASDQLPITICYTSDVDEIYEELLGTEYLGVPCGGSERLGQWPGLTAYDQILEVQGKGWVESAADVVLSSAGWVAITSGNDNTCQFRAWTPHGRGVYLRQPPLLRFAVNFRGTRVRGSPAYRQGRAFYIKNK